MDRQVIPFISILLPLILGRLVLSPSPKILGKGKETSSAKINKTGLSDYGQVGFQSSCTSGDART